MGKVTDDTLYPNIATPTADARIRLVNDVSGTPADGHVTWSQVGGGGGGSSWDYQTIPADANINAAVNTWYHGNISGYTTGRDLVLPATAAVGDAVAISLSGGDDLHELSIKNNTGQTINGVNHATTEWSRLFITGEVLILRCMVANTAWQVEQDGRIAQVGEMRLENSQAAHFPNTSWTKIVFDTEVTNPHSTINLSENCLEPRRGGTYVVNGYFRTNLTTGTIGVQSSIRDNTGTTAYEKRPLVVYSSAIGNSGGAVQISIAAADVKANAGRIALYGISETNAELAGSGIEITFMTLAEIL